VQYDGNQSGLILGLASGCAFGVQTVMFRRSRSTNPLVLVWLACGGSAFLLLLTSYSLNPPSITASNLGALALMALVQFSVPYLFYSASLQRISAQKASLLILIEPILSPIWVWIWLGEVPHLSTICGGLFIFSSVFFLMLTSASKYRRGKTLRYP
jgi:drug/metabolite transporter (DMT)-like permease